MDERTKNKDKDERSARYQLHVEGQLGYVVFSNYQSFVQSFRVQYNITMHHLFQALHDNKLNVEKDVEHSGRLSCTL